MIIFSVCCQVCSKDLGRKQKLLKNSHYCPVITTVLLLLQLFVIKGIIARLSHWDDEMIGSRDWLHAC